MIKKTSLNVYIEGHTDSLPIKTKRFPSNWELSVARAVNVAQVLVERFAVSPARIGVSGYGDSMPIGPNDTAENRAGNRRIDIVLAKF